MRHGRRDNNQRAVAKALMDVGATVVDTADMGDGFPDLVVGYKGVTVMFEVKGPQGRLTEHQVAFQGAWRGGPLFVVRSPQEARDALFEAVGLVN